MERFVPLATGSHNNSRKDAEGEFLRKVVATHPYGKKYNRPAVHPGLRSGRTVVLNVRSDEYDDPKLVGWLRRLSRK